MTDTNVARKPRIRLTSAAAFLAAGAITGGILAGTLSANAASTPAPSTSSSTSSSTEAPAANFPAHGSAAHEDQEKTVTGANAAKAQAAAVKALGGGTAGAVTTDFTGNGYEVTVTKSDGTTTEVHMDSAFNVMQGRGGFGG
jgi:hypothetical protein